MITPKKRYVNDKADDLAMIIPSTTLNKLIFAIDSNSTRIGSSREWATGFHAPCLENKTQIGRSCNDWRNALILYSQGGNRKASGVWKEK